MNTVSGTIFMTLNFILTYEWAQKARMLRYTRPKGSIVKKQSSLLEAFVSYEENEVLQIHYLCKLLTTFYFFLTYEWAQKA
jgi:hypothetical protein